MIIVKEYASGKDEQVDVVVAAPGKTKGGGME